MENPVFYCSVCGDHRTVEMVPDRKAGEEVLVQKGFYITHYNDLENAVLVCRSCVINALDLAKAVRSITRAHTHR
jgi:hypothetical protein